MMYEFETWAAERRAENDWANAPAEDERLDVGTDVLIDAGDVVWHGVVSGVRGGKATITLGATNGGGALLGTAEVAELLGVERPRIGRWVGKGQMPQPVQITRATPIWRRRHIEAMRDKVQARRKARITA